MIARSIGASVENAPYEIRVGLMFPKDIPLLEDKIGFASSAGAIPIALDRIQREGLLPGAQWRWVMT